MNNYLKLKEVHEIAIKHGFTPAFGPPIQSGYGDTLFTIHTYEKGTVQFIYSCPSYAEAATGIRPFIKQINGNTVAAFTFDEAIQLIQVLARIVHINPDGDDSE